MDNLPPSHRPEPQRYFDVYPKNRAAPSATSRPLVRHEEVHNDPMVMTHEDAQQPEPAPLAAAEPAANLESFAPKINQPDSTYMPPAESAAPILTPNQNVPIPPPSPSAPPKATRSNLPKIIALTAVVVLAVTGGVLYFLHI